MIGNSAGADKKMQDLTLQQMNLEIAMANLKDCIDYCVECQERLDDAMRGIAEIRRRLSEH